MFGIGAFARIAQVSQRTLRYYHDEGLLAPATVDPRSGYRWYNAEQLARLNRILALRDLGLSLVEIRQVLNEELSAGELRGMLRLRQIEVRQRLEAETARLTRVEARLRQIEGENRLGDHDVVVKSLEPCRVAFLFETAAAFGNDILGPIFTRLYPRLQEELSRGGIRPSGPAVALYGESGDQDAPIKVMAALPIAAAADPRPRVELAEFAGVDRAATMIHKGSMTRVDESYQALAAWADETGERIDGFCREVYLECEVDSESWVTELQFPLAREGTPGGMS